MLKYPDEMQGPVLKAAKMSLETSNVNYILIWLPEESENCLTTQAYTWPIAPDGEIPVNIRSLAKGLKFCGEATGKRQTYYVFESGAGYVVMSASRTKRASGYFNLVRRSAVDAIRRRYAGKQDVRAKQLATRSRGAGVRDALQALNILYVRVATGAAERDDRHTDTRLHFNIKPR